jgi:DNA-binding MarR family transcriptional regulator
MSVHVSDRDYERLLELRTGLRRFLHWSEEQADALGLSASQHQLLLAVRGHPGRRGPTIGEVAESLLLRHHSAVGLVRRIPDHDDHRVVRLRPTPLGSRRLRQLSERHLDELHRLRPLLEPIWDDLPV